MISLWLQRFHPRWPGTHWQQPEEAQQLLDSHMASDSLFHGQNWSMTCSLWCGWEQVSIENQQCKVCPRDTPERHQRLLRFCQRDKPTFVGCRLKQRKKKLKHFAYHQCVGKLHHLRSFASNLQVYSRFHQEKDWEIPPWKAFANAKVTNDLHCTDRLILSQCPVSQLTRWDKAWGDSWFRRNYSPHLHLCHHKHCQRDFITQRGFQCRNKKRLSETKWLVLKALGCFEKNAFGGNNRLRSVRFHETECQQNPPISWQFCEPHDRQVFMCFVFWINQFQFFFCLQECHWRLLGSTTC